MATTTPNLHFAALRIPILHILRAAGFHGTKPSVLDTLVNITERYLLLLAARAAAHASANRNALVPDERDVRLALADCGALLPTGTAAEEAWAERLRVSLRVDGGEVVVGGAARAEQERVRREGEDAADVAAFAEWVFGERNREIRRVAGVLPQAGGGAGVAGARIGDGAGSQEDYLTALKRRNKAVVDEERWAGTALGADREDNELTIVGGELGSVNEWAARMKERQNRAAGEGSRDVEMTEAGG